MLQLQTKLRNLTNVQPWEKSQSGRQGDLGPLSDPVLVVQLVELLHDLSHRLPFGLRDKTQQKGWAEQAVGHEDQEAELAEATLLKTHDDERLR